MQHGIITDKRASKEEKSSDGTQSAPSLNQVLDIQAPQLLVHAVFLLLCSRSQLGVDRPERQKGVGQDSQAQHPGTEEAVVLGLGMGKIGIDEMGATGNQDQGWHNGTTQGTHSLPLFGQRLVRGVLEVAGDVHVRGKEEAACFLR